ncbi:MAG: hypothetical protein JXX14_03330 [Deltaproteobacteria bacterium]|nr:hypothetical protein [Deltaproteobacteria bacterium]
MTIASVHMDEKETIALKGSKKDCKSSWLDMCREQAGYRRQGIAVTVEPVQGEHNG